MEDQALLEVLLDHQGIGDALVSLNLGSTLLLCERCGQASKQRCSACKAMAYCSVRCQDRDWIMGHMEECEAITGNLPWDDASVGESVILERHAERMAQVEGPHGGGGGGHMGGGGHWGGGGGGVHWGGGGGGGARWGSRGAWGPGWGRRGWGYGRGLYWLPYYGLWYPWWFWIPPYYYAQGLDYWYQGRNYGPPPLPPGQWGSYAQGGGHMGGYSQIPDQQMVGAEAELVGWPSFRRGAGGTTNQLGRLAREHVELTVDLTRAIIAGKTPDAGPLKTNAAQWAKAKLGTEREKGEFLGVMNAHITMMGTYLVARYQKNDVEADRARDTMRGAMAEAWAAFWSKTLVPPEGTPLEQFRHQVYSDMVEHINTTEMYVKDLVMTVDTTRKEAVRKAARTRSVQSVRAAVKHGEKMGERLDNTTLRSAEPR